MSHKHTLMLALLVLLLPALTLALPGAARAAGAITVSTTADLADGDTSSLAALLASPGPDGKISLREAIVAANGAASSAAAPHVITVPAGTYSLSGGELQLGTSLNAGTRIVGAGAAATIIQQTAASARVFNLDPNVSGGIAVSISGVTISGGTGTTFGGGGILAGGPGDSLSLDGVVISGNTTSGGNQGGGISWGGGGSLTISNSAIVGNSSDLIGGGIAFNQTGNAGNLTISRTTIANNTVNNPAGGQGGGLLITGHNTATLTNVDISGNRIAGGAAVNQQGGAIDIQGGTLSVSFSRIVGNVAGSGSAIYTAGGAATTADDTWWGCNGGPGASCGVIANANDGIGTLTLTRWLQARASISPATITAGQTATVSADILGRSSGGAAAPGDLAGLPGFPYTSAAIFPSATGGSLSNAAGQLVGGQASATFAPAGCTPGGASVSVDGESLSPTVDVTCSPTGPATITIMLDTQPDSRTNFRFTGGLGSFTLDDITPQDRDPFSSSKSFSVPAGTYTVTEQLSPLWSNPNMFCSPPQGTIVDLDHHQLVINATAGANITCTVITQRNGEIVAGAYNDRNGNHQQDRGDSWLGGWQMQITNLRTLQTQTQTTSHDGRAFFRNLLPDSYQVCEALKAGWQSVTPGQLDPASGQPCYRVTVDPGQAVWARFGNSRN